MQHGHLVPVAAAFAPAHPRGVPRAILPSLRRLELHVWGDRFQDQLPLQWLEGCRCMEKVYIEADGPAWRRNTVDMRLLINIAQVCCCSPGFALKVPATVPSPSAV